MTGTPLLPPPREFIPRLKRALQVRNLSVADLARLIGAPYQTVYGYVTGRANPSIGGAMEIASVLQISLDWLVGLTDEDPDWCVPEKEGSIS